MRQHPFLRRALAPLAPLALLAAVSAPAVPPLASRPHASPAVVPARRARHPRVYGYLEDGKPSTDSVLDVYSKTHKTTYHVTMMSSTVVMDRTQVVHRASLTKGLYVIVTCQPGSHGTLDALKVHIEHPRRRSRKH